MVITLLCGSGNTGSIPVGRPKNMKGFVYVLHDDFNKFYIGSTTDPDRRYKRHLAGFVYTTKRMKNPKMVLCQEFETIKQAQTIELRLKKLKRKDYIQKLINDGEIKMK